MGLTTISEALDSLGTKAKHIQPIFITLDPLRDTAEVLKSYKENFHRIVRLLLGICGDLLMMNQFSIKHLPLFGDAL